MINLDSVPVIRDITLLTKLCLVMYGCESWTKEDWVPKNWCFQTVVLEKSLESPFDYKEIKPVNPKGNQSWIFTGRTDAEDEAPILRSTDATSQLIRKHPDAGKDWGQEEKAMTEDEMVGWHHRLNGHESEQAPGWWRTVHGVPKSRTRLSDWTTTIATEWSYLWVTSINIFIFATKGMWKKTVIFVFLHCLSLL